MEKIKKRNKFKEMAATVRGAVYLFCMYNSLFIVFGVISLSRIFEFGAGGEFRIGNVPIVKWMGAGASNLDVFLFCATGVVLVTIVIVRRYFYFRKDIELLRSKGIYDVNKDGKIDSFADNLFD